MTPEDFQKFFPLVDNWIWAALAAHAGTARPVASCGFPRLPLYFTAETLASAKVVIMDRLPVPPLSSWGLTQFGSFERGDPDGPATIVPGSHPSGAKGVARPPANCISGRFPQPVHITIRQSKASRRQAAITAPVSHQKRSQQDATNTIERVKSSGKSTPAILVPPLITVWLEV